MKYLLFLLLLSSCSTRRLIVSQELPDRIIYKVPGKWVWGNIMKDSRYQDYRQDPGLFEQARPLAPGDLVIWDKKKHRFEARLFGLTYDCCGRKHEVWEQFGYADMRVDPKPDKCQCK